MKIIAAALLLLSTTGGHAETVVAGDVGPWQMLQAQTHDDLPGAAQVFLLNTKTGAIMVCRFQPSGGLEARGCYPMLARDGQTGGGPLVDRPR